MTAHIGGRARHDDDPGGRAAARSGDSLGASPSRLAWWIVGHGLTLTAAGVALGLSLGSAAARSLASLVYSVSPYDAAPFAGTAAAIVSGAALMTYAAALRARSIDPIAVLKQE